MIDQEQTLDTHPNCISKAMITELRSAAMAFEKLHDGITGGDGEEVVRYALMRLLALTEDVEEIEWLYTTNQKDIVELKAEVRAAQVLRNGGEPMNTEKKSLYDLSMATAQVASLIELVRECAFDAGNDKIYLPLDLALRELNSISCELIEQHDEEERTLKAAAQ